MDASKLYFIGKFALSIDLGSGPLYLAVEFPYPRFPNIVLTGAYSEGAAFAAYEVFGSNPRLVVLQSNFSADNVFEPGSTFVGFGAGNPDQYGAYTPSAGIVSLRIAGGVGSAMTAGAASTQLLLTDIGAHLVARADAGKPRFFAQPGGAFDSGRWGVRTLLDAASAPWDGADLRGLQWIGWRLTGKSAQRALLARADLSGAKFMRCDFTAADLTKANLRGSDWSGATDRCTLARAVLARADLSGAQFQYCAMAGADLGNATCSTSTNFRYADLSGAKFTNVDLSGVDFTGATLRGADFTGAKLRGANLADASLDHATLSGVSFTGARFSPRTRLAGASMNGADLHDLDLTGVDLTGADLTNAALGGTVLAGATMSGTKFDGTDLTTATFSDPPGFSRDARQRTSFRNAKLNFSTIGLNWSFLDLSEATLMGLPLDLAGLNALQAVFRGAQLANATLKSACFDGADLTGANLSGADLTGASLKQARLGRALLTNARLVRAQLTGAQLGAKQALFTLPSSRVAALDAATLSADLKADFAAQQQPLPLGAQVQVRIKGQDWLLVDALDRNKPLFHLGASADAVLVSSYKAELAANLTDAYMPEAVLTDANLCQCLLGGAQWYSSGTAAMGDNADFEGVDFAQANLGGINLSQARLFGAIFSRATLVNANLSGANLGPSAEGRAVSFDHASLQGASFTQARLDGANFTGAAVSLDRGVPLFALDRALAAEFVRGAPSEKLGGAFLANGYTLLPGSSVGLDPGSGMWVVQNGGDTPPTAGTGAYVAFNVLKRADGMLQVYGAGLWISGIDEQGHQAFSQASYGPTALSQNDMQPVSAFPNGQPYSAFGHPMTWEQMMTARQPPSPPPCIPSPDRWCAPASATAAVLAVDAK